MPRLCEIHPPRPPEDAVERDIAFLGLLVAVTHHAVVLQKRRDIVTKRLERVGLLFRSQVIFVRGQERRGVPHVEPDDGRHEKYWDSKLAWKSYHSIRYR